MAMEKSTATRAASDDRQAAASLAQRRQSGVGTAGALSGEVGQRTGAGFGPRSEKAAASQQPVDNSPRVTAQRKQIESAFGMPVQRQGSEEEELLQGKFDLIQRQGPEEEELLQGKFAAVQRQGPKEEELLQGKFEAIQRQGSEEEELLQGKFGAAQRKQEPSPKANNNGLPFNLKEGLENLSGMSMDDVKVHYNSSQPAQLNALAYAQGTDIHVASGQEQHLPHEAWHVVQQAQRRVKPTMQMKDGVLVNDDQGLEHEADVMGAEAVQMRSLARGSATAPAQGPPAGQRRSAPTHGSDAFGHAIGVSRQKHDLNFQVTTQGADIRLAPDLYQPNSNAGRVLVGHELAHVAQQSEGRVRTTTQMKGVVRFGAGDAVQRKEPRRTETRVLGAMGPGGNLSAQHSQDLSDKMDKGQSTKRARAIAAQTEAESNTLVAGLLPNQQGAVREAIRNYVASSSAIQGDARNNPNAPNQAVQALDAALNAIRQQIAAIGGGNDRIVYRSISYDSGAKIPYGQANDDGNIINVGDFVGDLGFLSTSEHRQFVVGKEQTRQVQGLLKLAIHSRTGVPIAIDIPRLAYSNTNQQALYDQQQNRRNKLVRTWNAMFGAGALAGQAEVLFSRNTVFEVKSIQRDGDKVSVVVEEFVGPRPAQVLNMKYGTPI
jgi:hypothetical protein